MSETSAKDPSSSNCFTGRNVLQVNSTMRAAEHDTMHYCFVWKKWQWPVSLWMEANLCLNTGSGRVVRGELSGGRRRRRAVYWELDQWQVNPLWRKPFIFVKAFLLEIHRGGAGRTVVGQQMEKWQKLVGLLRAAQALEHLNLPSFIILSVLMLTWMKVASSTQLISCCRITLLWSLL